MEKDNNMKTLIRGLVFCAGSIWLLHPQNELAAPVSELQASNAVLHAAAIHYPASSTSPQRFNTQSGWSRRSIKRLNHVTSGGETIGYSVALEPSGYYLVPSDDELPPWKLRAEEGTFEDLPPGLISVLKLELAEDRQALLNLKKANRSPNAKFHEQWKALQGVGDSTGTNPLPTGTSGVYLLTTTWDQGDPYNLYCPTASGGPGGRAWAGCTACALSQVLRYRAQPSAVAQDYTYTDSSGACQGTHSISDAGMGPYDWGDMPTSASTGSTIAQEQAIGQLMYHAAVALNSDFEYNGTSASPSYVPFVLRTYFGYTCADYQSKSSYTSSQWYNMIASDIDSNKPVFYAMWQADGSDGHAVVCDGYQNGNEIHLNLGWSGSYNAWYNIDSVLVGGYTWTIHGAVFGITPPVSTTQYTINSSAGVNGSIDPSGVLTNNAGENRTFTAYPNANYVVNEWLLDGGVTQMGNSSYTLTNIQTNHSVGVTFKVTPPQLSGMTMSNGVFRFILNGPMGSNYVIQASSNLFNWSVLLTNTIPSGGMRVIEFPIQTNQPKMFYRALPVFQGPLVLQPGPVDGNDIWTTSWYSYATCAGTGTGGGLNDDRLRVGGWSDWYYSLLQFNLTGLPTKATSAALYLYCYNLSGGGTPLYLDRITTTWDWRTSGTGCDRDRLWWADKPSAIQWVAGQLSTPTQACWYRVDITDLYNAWQNGTYPNYGVQLRPVLNSNNNFDEFYSADYTGDPTLRPKLVITPAN